MVREVSGRFGGDFIDRVREANDLVGLISQHVELKRSSGQQYMGLCPFHNERSPSFSVSEAKQVYHCFGCKKSGNVFTFIQDILGLTFGEAVEYLAKRAGLSLPLQYDKRPSRRRRLEVATRLTELAYRFYHKSLMDLPQEHAVWQYLQKRQVSFELAKELALGWSHESWDSLTRVLEERKAPLHEAEKIGLIRRRQTGDGYYDLFRGRLIFPIFSPTGTCLGFGGRTIGEDKPKYLNSPESDLFHKGGVFYGLNLAAKHIRSEGQAIVVEGYMDFVGLHRSGIKNVLATLGTALTREHGHLLKKYTRQVIVLFDGDAAGQAAALRSLPILLAEGLLPRGVILPDGLDPDEFITEHGAAAMNMLLKNSRDLFEVLLDLKLGRRSRSASEQVLQLDEWAPVLRVIEDRRLQQLYVKVLAEWLQVAPQMVWDSLRKRPEGRHSIFSPKAASLESKKVEEKGGGHEEDDQARESAARIRIENPPAVELELLSAAFLYEKGFKKVMNRLNLSHLKCQGIADVLRRAFEYYGQPSCQFDNLPALLVGEVESRSFLTQHLERPYSQLSEEGALKLVSDCLKRINQAYLRSQAQVIAQSIRSHEISPTQEQLEQIMNIERRRRSVEPDI